MSDEAAFLRTIQANPADTTAKLVYADWLDDQGMRDKARYVRGVARAPLTKHGYPAPSQELADLGQQLPLHWFDLFSGATLLWDSVTMVALGRLQGLLDTFAVCSCWASDVGYLFKADLRPLSGTVQQVADAYGRTGSARLEHVDDWETELRTTLRERLLGELGQVSSPARLALQVDYGRDGIINHAIRYVTAVITPKASWRLTNTESLSWVCEGRELMLEANDRVLFLHFSSSD